MTHRTLPEKTRNPFLALPPLPGVYILRGPAGEVYVGSTTNLRARANGHRSKHPGWTFHIVERLPGATNDALRMREEEVIVRLVERGVPVHNKNNVGRPNQYSKITAFGKSQSITDWERETRIKRNTIYGRIYAGWSMERALSEPPTGRGRLHRNNKKNRLRFIGEMATRIMDDDGNPLLVVETAERLGIRKEALDMRLRTMRNVDGVTEITMEQLRNMTWRSKPRP